MKATRRQLTLFLNETASKHVERIRQQFNPVQYNLIKSHITLCREDELEDWATIQRNLEQLAVAAFELETAPVERFWHGKGVFVPILDKQQHFQRLRTSVLQHAISNPRIHEPHITLMHPRNSTCTDSIFQTIQNIPIPPYLSISTISLIEQEVGKVWKTLEIYPLRSAVENKFTFNNLNNNV